MLIFFSNSLQSYVLDELIFVKKNFIFFADKRETYKYFFTYKMNSLGFRRYTCIHQYIKFIPGNGMNKYEIKVHTIVS